MDIRVAAAVGHPHSLRFVPGSEQGFECVRVANSPVTHGDPSARSSGWRLCLFQGAKILAWLAAEAVRLLSLGRLHVAPSILVVARKRRGDAGASSRGIGTLASFATGKAYLGEAE